MSRRTLAVMLTAVLIGGLIAAPADAGKKKKKKKPVPVEVQYFLQSNPDDACNEAGWVLALAPAESAGCGVTDSGIPNELLIQSGTDPRGLGQQFTAQEGIPVVLDTSKKLAGEITTRGFNQVALGQPTIEINVFGTAGGEEVAIGSFSEEAVVAPTQMHTSKFEIDIAEEAKGATFEGLSVQVLIRGASVGHSVVEMNTPTSFIVVPTLQKK